MRWLLWALWGLGGGPGGVPGGAGCLLCSPRAAAALGGLLGPFLMRALPRQPALRARVGTLLLRGVLGLGRLPQHPDTFMGVIDEATLEEASTHFRRTIARVMEQNLQDEQLFNELLWAMQEVKDDFERLMRRFQSQVFCRNNCGRMEVVWIECISCNVSLFACNRGVYCGERQLRVEEGEDLLLDCSLAWHRAAHGTKTYRFYREAPPGEQLLASGPDPVLVQKEAVAAAAGRYRCEMRNPKGRLGSELRFNVTVTPRTRPHWQPPAPPPPGPARVPPPVAAAAAAAAAAVLGAAVAAATWLRRRRRRRAPEDTAPPLN